MTLRDALAEWKSLLGEDRVLEQSQLPEKFSRDTAGHRASVPALIRVSRREQLQGVMQVASRHRVRIHPVSSGNNWGYGSALPVEDDTCVLDLSDLKQVIDFDEELGVVTLEPGVTQGELQAYLDRLELPFMTPVTGAGPHCSLVGNALERGYGITPISDHYAAVTDMEVVLADGTIHRSALAELGHTRIARLHKWDLGPHLAGLFTQSGLGVVRTMSIALARRPDCIKACVFGLPDLQAVSAFVPLVRNAIRTLGAGLGGLNLMNSHRVISMLGKHPNDSETGCEPLTAPQLRDLEKRQMVTPWTGFGSLYGSRRMVAAAQRELRAILGGKASRMLFVDEPRADQIASVAKLLPGNLGTNAARSARTLRSALGLLAGRPNETTLPLAYWLNHRRLPAAGQPLDPARDGCGLIWFAPLVPMSSSSVQATVDMVVAVSARHHIEPLVTLTSLNDRLFDCTVPILYRADQPGRIEAAQRCYFEMVEAGSKLGIYPYRLAAFGMHLMPAANTQAEGLHRRLKNCLDPDEILAPGRYL